MIKTMGIQKIFNDPKRGEIQAVYPTSFEIQQGEIFGLLGPNGAGKTTLLRMLATILSPTAGSALVHGFDLLKFPEKIKKSIGFLSGNTKLYARLSPRELLVYFGSLYDIPLSDIQKRSTEIFDILDMHTFADQRIEKLSTGQVQKTSIARTILHNPPVYILDEPTLGLDILTSRSIIEFIRESSSLGKTILLSTHYMEEAEMLCDRIGLLHQGKLLDVDSLENLRKKRNLSHLADIFMATIEGAV
jgi:sodium transport system ATP-binding protein